MKRLPFDSPVDEAMLSLIRTADVLSRPTEALFAQAGLSAAQYNVLRILRGVGPAGLPCGQIAQRMMTRDPDMTRLLDRLQRAHFITRIRQQDDRRVVRAYISLVGEAVLHGLDEPLMKLQQAQLQHMTTEEIKLLIQMLEVARGGSPRANSVGAGTEHPPTDQSVSKEGLL